MLPRATYHVSIGNNIDSHASPVASPTIPRALLPMTSKANKLPQETEPVASDYNTGFMLKPGDQTFFAPYSYDNRSAKFKNATEIANKTAKLHYGAGTGTNE